MTGQKYKPVRWRDLGVPWKVYLEYQGEIASFSSISHLCLNDLVHGYQQFWRISASTQWGPEKVPDRENNLAKITPGLETRESGCDSAVGWREQRRASQILETMYLYIEKFLLWLNLPLNFRGTAFLSMLFCVIIVWCALSIVIAERSELFPKFPRLLCCFRFSLPVPSLAFTEYIGFCGIDSAIE